MKRTTLFTPRTLLLSACCLSLFGCREEGCDCGEPFRPTIFQFANETAAPLDVVWSDKTGAEIVSTVLPGRRCSTESSGYVGRSVLHDYQTGCDTTYTRLTWSDSGYWRWDMDYDLTFRTERLGDVRVAVVLDQERQEQWVAEWLLDHVEEGQSGAQPTRVWHLSESALDSLSQQAAEAGYGDRN